MVFVMLRVLPADPALIGYGYGVDDIIGVTVRVLVLVTVALRVIVAVRVGVTVHDDATLVCAK